MDPSSASAQALDALIDALHVHHHAATNRAGEADAACYAAYRRLSAALESYEDALFTDTEEPTPWRLPRDLAEDAELEAEDPDPELAPGLPGFTLLTRRDFAVEDPAAVTKWAARRLRRARVAEPVVTVADAVVVLAEFVDPATLAARAERHGLRAGYATTWVLPDAGLAVDDDAPFAVADLVLPLAEIGE